MGGGLLPVMGRLDFGWRLGSDGMPERAKMRCQRLPSEYLKLMYSDTITHSNHALSYLVNTMGSRNVLLGTDFPYDMGQYDIVSKINDMSSLNPEDKAFVMGENSSKLFKIK